MTSSTLGIDSQQAQAFRARWQAVAAIELREMQQASIEQRWQQFNAILRMASALQLSLPENDENDEMDLAAVRQRWIHLTARLS